MKIFYMGIAIFLFGCANSPEFIYVEQPNGNRIVSLTFTAPHGPERKADVSGIELYLNYYHGNPVISGYEYSGGKIVDTFGGGVEETAYFLGALSQIDFSPFSYHEEITKAAAAKEKSGDNFDIVTLDGVKWAVYIKTRSGEFTFEDWNPGTVIHNLSGYSDNIQKLELVLQLINSFYGQSKIGLYSDLCIPEQLFQNCKAYKFR